MLTNNVVSFEQPGPEREIHVELIRKMTMSSAVNSQPNVIHWYQTATYRQCMCQV